ncbi:MAG TPA: HupE/UreJ family protein [Chthoniobacterales bacterium]
MHSRAARFSSFSLLTALVLLAPSLAQAHPGHGAHTHFLDGFAHPINGLDHILAMIAVGIFAVQRGGRAIWAVPAAFVTAMAFGGILGMSHFTLPMVETGILLSVPVLGILIALVLAKKLPLWVGILTVATSAIFHGYAHGAEMPVHASGFQFAAGFLIATAALHASGIAFGLLVGRFGQIQLIRVAGASIAVLGAGLWIF